MEPNPSCAILTPSNCTVLSGPLTMQAFGVCEKETSWRDTFIWISQQMGPKCVSCSITAKHTQPVWWIQYPFWSINLTDWKGKGFFFQCHAAFSALQMITFLCTPSSSWIRKWCLDLNTMTDSQADRCVYKNQTESWIIFLHQPPKTCTWNKELQGRNLSNLLNLKTQAINYSQPIHFSSSFVP